MLFNTMLILLSYEFWKIKTLSPLHTSTHSAVLCSIQMKNIMRLLSFSWFFILVVKKTNLIFQLILGIAWTPVHQIADVKTNLIEDKFFAVSCNTC